MVVIDFSPRDISVLVSSIVVTGEHLEVVFFE